MKTPIQLLREASILHRATRCYESMYESLSELEQMLAGAGDYEKAEEAHQAGIIALRAWDAERDDPEPR